MLLLAIDTSGKNGSIALAKCGPGEACESLEVVALAGGTFSAQLVPQISELLTKHKFSKSDLGAFAAVSGPGSFTGLRVGLAAIKALAETLGKPIAAVSLLEAVAMVGGRDERVFAALDAGRNEVYAGEYQQDRLEAFGEQLLARDEFVEICRGRVVVTPDSLISQTARLTALEVVLIDRPRSDTIARLGWKKIAAGETVSPENLEANYIRRSDAEIFSKPASYPFK
ncbi:MAG TPA: tRNA (adenosine(37)-N6)-threonylcarbamoyltransferase complex dimerization subunit type 1 TsaB [Terriglobales bacterium]